MKKLIILIFILFSVLVFGQHPPEYLTFYFSDTTGKTIYPELTVYENNIQYKEDADSLYIQSNNLKINFDDKLDGRFGQYTNTDKDTVTVIHSIIPTFTLGQEMKIIAKYENKIMQITFFGQSMRNFDCWKKWEKQNIIFKEGYFHYYIVNTSGNYETFLHNTKKPLEIFKNTRVQKIDSLKKYFGLNQKEQVVSLTEILNPDDKYLGYIFDKNTPIGYGIAENNSIRLVKINPQIIKILKKYYN